MKTLAPSPHLALPERAMVEMAQTPELEIRLTRLLLERAKVGTLLYFFVPAALMWGLGVYENASNLAWAFTGILFASTCVRAAATAYFSRHEATTPQMRKRLSVALVIPSIVVGIFSAILVLEFGSSQTGYALMFLPIGYAAAISVSFSTHLRLSQGAILILCAPSSQVWLPVGDMVLWSCSTLYMLYFLNIARKLHNRQIKLERTTIAANELRDEAQASAAEATVLRDKAEEQAEQLQTLSEQQTRFFQNISHELRTPLTLILNPLERQTVALPDNQEIAIATNNARRLLRLVNQLLDFQKLEAGKKELKLEPVDLVGFTRLCGDYFASACSTKGVDFKVQANGEALESIEQRVFVLGEVDAMEKVAFNYLSNALKYTPSTGSIEFGFETNNDEKVRLFVRDTGPGIPKASQKKLFQVFSQVDEGPSRAYEGTGLGLALVKSLAEEMRGQVGVQSTPGHGSTFWADFPICETEGDSIENLDFQQRRWLLAEGEGRTGKDEEIDNDPISAEIALADEFEALGETILVVDDLQDMRNLIGVTLRECGYHVRSAPNGKIGFEKAQQIKPHLIISDWMMPEMTGPELIHSIRHDAELNATPIILLTAKSDEESKLIGTEIGADAFLGKPFNDKELTSTVRNLLKLKSSEREVQHLNELLTESVLKRYLPPDLVDQILSGETSLDQAPRSVVATVLFADLEGFTLLSGELRATKIARVLNEYLTAMTDVIFEHGGTVDKFIGDAIMVLFGAPTALVAEEQARQAADCALAMQAAMRRLNAKWEAEQTPTLKMRIGVHQGPVVVGTFGSAKRSDYTAIGPAVNMASRIEGVCKPGETYVSGEVCDFLPEELAESVGKFELRGVEGTKSLYRLLANDIT